MVVAIAGASAGKTGKVLQVMPSRGRALVEGLNLVKKHMRKSQDNPKGSIVQKESSLAISNLLLYCPDCKKGVRVKRVKEGDKRTRRCRSCNRGFDS
jgi:large subunit ribosomal protein L24